MPTPGISRLGSDDRRSAQNKGVTHSRLSHLLIDRGGQIDDREVGEANLEAIEFYLLAVVLFIKVSLRRNSGVIIPISR